MSAQMKMFQYAHKKKVQNNIIKKAPILVNMRTKYMVTYAYLRRIIILENNTRKYQKKNMITYAQSSKIIILDKSDKENTYFPTRIMDEARLLRGELIRSSNLHSEKRGMNQFCALQSLFACTFHLSAVVVQNLE